MNQRILTSALLALILSFSMLSSTRAIAASSPGQAASQAKSAYGGKVLSSKDTGKAYRVKLLLEGGRVKTVTINKSQ